MTLLSRFDVQNQKWVILYEFFLFLEQQNNPFPYHLTYKEKYK